MDLKVGAQFSFLDSRAPYTVSSERWTLNREMSKF